MLAALEAKYQGRLECQHEMDLIAHMISCHEDLGVGPGRAEKCLTGFLESKLDVANAIVNESEEDEDDEFLITQRDLAKLLKSIFGAAGWERHKTKFPMLKEFWDKV